MASDRGTASGSVLVGAGFVILWILATSLGWAVGGPVGVEVSPSMDSIVSGFLGVALGAILAGALQWTVLRRQIPAAGGWVLAVIGAVAVSALVIFLVGRFDADLGWVLGVALLGAVGGTFQWLMLQPQLPRAGWWVLASTIGWVVSMPLAGVLGLGEDVTWAVLGGLYGAITGPVLLWLLRR